MKVRVAAVNFKQQPLSSAKQFFTLIETHLAFAVDSGAQLIVYPEYVTSSLLSLDPHWDKWTAIYIDQMIQLARRYRIHILGGTHLVFHPEEKISVNQALFFDPQGNYAIQAKVHATPFERKEMKLSHSRGISLFELSFGKVAILVCYDVEFPELCRIAVNAGAKMLLVPSFTDDLHGYCRVRFCAQARCIENQVYVVQSCLTGQLPGVRHFEQSYGKAAIFGPCDLPFSPYGVIAEAEITQELCIVGECDLSLLDQMRLHGSVTPLQDLQPLQHYAIHHRRF